MHARRGSGGHGARWSTVVVATSLALAAGCGASSTRTAHPGSVARCRAAPSPSAPRFGRVAGGLRHAVATFVDRDRSSPDPSEDADLPCRILRTEIWMPAHRRGVLPLVVVAHGVDGDPSALGRLLGTWARAGYVVAAPKLPTTEKGAGGVALPKSGVDQAHDLSLIVTELLRSNARPTSSLFGTIDPGHIGAAGMSFGGLAVYGLISNTCCRDDRIRAAVLMAAVRREIPDEHYEENRAPVLLVQGDADRGYHNSVEAYPRLAPPKWFITLHGAHHSPPFEVPAGPFSPLVASTSTSFWNRYLRGDAAAATDIVREIRATHGRATLRHVTRAP